MPFDNGMKFKKNLAYSIQIFEAESAGTLIMRTRCRPTYKQYENQTDKRTNKVNKNSALQKLARLGLPLPNAQTKKHNDIDQRNHENNHRQHPLPCRHDRGRFVLKFRVYRQYDNGQVSSLSFSSIFHLSI
ncbi:hypothetical protein AB9R15_05655 [Neisseria gonorrhoeae]